MKGWIYARESSDDAERAPPITNQIDIGKRWFSEHKHELAGVFQDEGISGGKWNRPALLAAIDALNKGDIIWVWSQGRLARETEMFLWFMRKVAEKGCVLFINNKEADMKSASGRLTHTVIAAADEFQRREVSEKVKGIVELRRKEATDKNERFNWGRHAVPQELIDETRRLAAEGLSIRAIAKRLPPYKLKLRKGENEPRIRHPSVGWVGFILKRHSV